MFEKKEEPRRVQRELHIVRVLGLLLKLVLDVRMLDSVPDNPREEHNVDDRAGAVGLDVAPVIPFEEAHKRAAVERDALLQLGGHIGHFCFAAHGAKVVSAHKETGEGGFRS